MNVFVLCTGRCGSVTFTRACEHFTNYTSGHETRSRIIGDSRFDFPPNHIEVDNHFALQLGRLEQRFGDGAVYVHLWRDREAVARSFSRLMESRVSNVRAFHVGTLMLPNILPSDLMAVCRDYVDTATANIEAFMRNKSKTVSINIDDPVAAFQAFCEIAGADGDLLAATRTLTEKHNSKAKGYSLRHRLGVAVRRRMNMEL